MERWVVFCDESIERGDYFSNFYGAAIVREKELPRINTILNAKKAELNLGKEVKYTKITENYQSKYIALMETFFELIRAGDIKIRLLFTQNDTTAILTREQRANSYFLLYYQLIKHALGIAFADGSEPISLRISFDWFPEEKGRSKEFKEYICGLALRGDFLKRRIHINPEDLEEIDSAKHPILQCLDIVLGAMQGKLNRKHEYKEPGKRVRAKKTRAKEAVYKKIYQLICSLYPGYAFNPGITTGYRDPNPIGDSRWRLPYKHWRFVPTNAVPNPKYKPNK
jgi:hypothetical protein